MRTRFTKDDAGRVTIAYDDELHWTGEAVRVERTFTCPHEGGYVREYRKEGAWEQVCDKLESTGNTLSCSSRDKLMDLIRAEYRAMRRAEKRAQA